MGEDSIRRFREEVRLLHRLDHPNVVKVIGFHLQEPPYWYVMPKYDHTLLDVLRAVKGDEDRIARIFGSILDAIEYTHGEGVIHRDSNAAIAATTGGLTMKAFCVPMVVTTTTLGSKTLMNRFVERFTSSIVSVPSVAMIESFFVAICRSVVTSISIAFVDYDAQDQTQGLLCPLVEPLSRAWSIMPNIWRNRPTLRINISKISPTEEKLVHKLLREKPHDDGLVAVLCCKRALPHRIKLLHGKQRPRLAFRPRPQPRPLLLYFLDPDFGLMYVRVQTMFPFHCPNLRQSATNEARPPTPPASAASASSRPTTLLSISTTSTRPKRTRRPASPSSTGSRSRTASSVPRQPVTQATLARSTLLSLGDRPGGVQHRSAFSLQGRTGQGLSAIARTRSLESLGRGRSQVSRSSLASTLLEGEVLHRP